MKTIHSRLGGKVPVWAVSHQGHEVPPSRDEANGGANGLPELKGEEMLKKPLRNLF